MLSENDWQKQASDTFDRGFDASIRSILAVGEVVEVRGRRVLVRVFRRKNGAILMYSGIPLRNVAVGSYVKFVKGFSSIMGIVEGESATADSRANWGYFRRGDEASRVLEVSVIGSLEGGSFVSGVKELPLVGSVCFLPTAEERTVSLRTGGADGLPLGHLASDPSQVITLRPGTLLASHVGIFGNTGSGKSYTLAKILSEVFRRYSCRPAFRKNARYLLIDFNGEYVDEGVIAPDDLKSSYVLDTHSSHGKDKVRLPMPVLCDARVWQVFLDATEKTQAPFLNRVFRNKWIKDIIDGSVSDLGKMIVDQVVRALSTTDKIVERNTAKNFLYEIREYVDDDSRLNIKLLIDKVSLVSYHSANAAYYFTDASSTKCYSDNADWEQRLRSFLDVPGFSVSCPKNDLRIIGAAIVLCYYDEIVKGFSNVDHLSPMIKRLNGRISSLNKVVEASVSSPLLEKPLTVISLRDVNIEMRKIIPMLVCNYAYEEMKNGGPHKFLGLVVDEAHNILSEESARESEQWKSYRLETFEEIIKEGRKYGVFLMLASQRPHDISPTIISQLHNYFIHRLMNEKDLQAIERAVSYIDRLSFDSIPTLPTGSCVVSGVALNRPLVVDVEEIIGAQPPASETIDIEELWS